MMALNSDIEQSNGCFTVGVPLHAHGGLWAVTFVWEIWRFKLAVKFATRIQGLPQNFLHSWQILWTLVGGGARALQVTPRGGTLSGRYSGPAALPTCSFE